MIQHRWLGVARLPQMDGRGWVSMAGSAHLDGCQWVDAEQVTLANWTWWQLGAPPEETPAPNVPADETQGLGWLVVRGITAVEQFTPSSEGKRQFLTQQPSEVGLHGINCPCVVHQGFIFFYKGWVLSIAFNRGFVQLGRVTSSSPAVQIFSWTFILKGGGEISKL